MKYENKYDKIEHRSSQLQILTLTARKEGFFGSGNYDHQT